MATNNSKIDQLHGNLPKHLNSENNPNWKAVVEAIGQSDEEIAQLVSEVRKQFFVKTASRPYLDRLGANSRISRPRLVGMDDASFREYIPVLSYQPKQVKLIIDKLLDVFFFKESTTAFITSQTAEPYSLNDGWELMWTVDQIHQERVVFKASDFTNINNIDADELVASINRQTKYSYATAYYDSLTKQTYIRMFVNTIGSKGSIQMVGGRADIALKFNGFIDTAGNGNNTEWTVTKIGDEVQFQHTDGVAPGLDQVQEGDIVILDIPNNKGSFVITNIDLSNNSFKFINLFGTPGTYVQTSANESKFIRPNKYTAYVNPRRAMTWETTPGEFIVEMPTSPPIVKRSLKGSIHLNGAFSLMSNRDSDSSLSVENAFQFPESGSFYLEAVSEIKTRILTGSENTIITEKFNGRLISDLEKYTYTSRVALATSGNLTEGVAQITNLGSVAGLVVGQQVLMDGVPPYARVTAISGNIANISFPATTTSVGTAVKFLGNTLTGITPSLPKLSDLNEFTLTSLSRSGNVVTGVTASAHGYGPGEQVIITGASGGPGGWDGSFVLASASGTTFTYTQLGATGGATTAGSARVERVGMSNTGSKVIITNAISNQVSRITGAYIWDLAAPFVLASNQGDTTELIQAGKTKTIINLGPNDLPNQEGFLIFDYGQNNQEGPIRYLYKPTNNTLAIDPSYTFKHTHTSGSTFVLVNYKGPHVMSGRGIEYAPYITDPSEARVIFEELVNSVKSAGIFVNFLVRYPEQLYATLDVYNSGIDPG